MGSTAKLVLGIVAALTAAGLIFKFVIRSKKDVNKTTQIGNKVGGDQAGRDIKK